jgi:DNA-binding response OmpR family regulator
MLFSPPTINGTPKAVLIADDDAMIVDLLAFGFEKHGFTVFKAQNGLDALNLFDSEQIDFVLTDIQMPKMDGKELSKRIRNRAPDTKIAVMTGGKIDVASELLQSGTADYFFSKPFDITNVCRIFTAEAQVV